WDGVSRFSFVIYGLDEQENGYTFIDFAALVEISPLQNEVRIIDINTNFAPVYVSPDVNRTIRNTLVYFESRNESVEMSTLLFDMQQLTASSIDGYIMVSKEGFQEIFKDLGRVNLTAPSEVYDSDLDGFMIERNSNIVVEDFLKFMAADENGYNDKMARQVSGIQELTKEFSTLRFLIGIQERFDNIENSVYTNISKNDLFRVFYFMKYRKNTTYRVGYIQSHPGYIVQTALGEVWRPVYETIDGDLVKVFINNDSKLEQATIDVLNSTRQAGLASSRARWLKNRGLRVVVVGNSQKELPITEIYVSEPEKFVYTLEEIKNTLYGEVEIIRQEYPDRSVGDIVVVLGEDEIITYGE
ncbi:LytR C-terminal domain-containing protein, partial [Candidatus Dojkabacteria bacterium]|nr:LytR C-terminal domain-containing protein [Candidatus Dojkabacteria bacterium]